MRKISIGVLVLLISGQLAYGQMDSLMDMLSGGPKNNIVNYTTATFKATRIIDGNSVENLGAGVLDFRISHRFGQLNQGAQNFFGLDNATTRLGLDYGITRWLMVGLGHSVLNKENDGFLKLKLLRQKRSGTPVTVSFASEMSLQNTPDPSLPTGDKWLYTNNMYFMHQVLIARKFNEYISLQLMPTVVHFNIVDSSKFDNNTFLMGAGGRIKLSKRIAVTGEYYYRLNNTDMRYNGQKTYNSFSLGIDIETGGHVFQLMVTNSTGLTERAFMTQSTDSWSNGGLHFGFNISRVFTIVKPKEFRGSENKGW